MKYISHVLEKYLPAEPVHGMTEEPYTKVKLGNHCRCAWLIVDGTARGVHPRC